MATSRLEQALDTALSGRRLLTHAFYRRWQEGRLRDEELAAYAAQYRHFEAALPGLLRSLLDRVGDGAARAALERNLDDEAGGPVTHLDLFEGFATAVGAPPSPPSPATARLLATYEGLLGDPAAAIAALVAYEMQAPEVAASKAEGLRCHHGLGVTATRFWDVHAHVDADHAAWGVLALERLLGDDTTTALEGARLAAQAWWEFLDEREAEAAVAA